MMVKYPILLCVLFVLNRVSLISMNIYRLIPMGQKVPSAIKEKVINAWLEAKPRNIIADENDISYGSVTNIIAEVKKESIKDIDC